VSGECGPLKTSPASVDNLQDWLGPIGYPCHPILFLQRFFSHNLVCNLPPLISSFTEAIQYATGYDQITSLRGLISISGIATNGKFIVKHGTWKEPLNLFQLLIAPPGSKKTQFFSILIDQLMFFISREKKRFHEANADRKILALKNLSELKNTEKMLNRAALKDCSADGSVDWDLFFFEYT
jgi:hypothetical protein